HVGIISKGQIIFQGSLPELGQLQQKQSRLLIHTSNDQLAMQILQAHGPEPSGRAISVNYNSEIEIAAMGRALHEKQLDIYLLHPQQNNLEQLFMDLTTQHA
ncbi:MAG: hypothetical protein REI93_14745, partial [Pedobacter sp.]|nr:hypothetical protein [Pedobacter sp.]